MLGDIIGTVVTGAFFLGVIIRLLIWAAMKIKEKKSYNKSFVWGRLKRCALYPPPQF